MDVGEGLEVSEPEIPEQESAVVQAWRRWRVGNDSAGRGAAFAGGWEAATADLRRAVESLPTNHINWYGPDGEHEDHGYVVRQQDVYDLLEHPAEGRQRVTT